MTRTSRKIAWYIITILLCLIFATPLVWMIVGSLKNPEELAASMTYTFLPRVPQWQHFREVLLTNEVLRFWPAMLNSMVHAVSIALLTTLSSSLAGFGFARYKARGSEFLFGILLATLMLPWVITFIPTYMVFNQLHLVGLNPWPLGYLPFWIGALPGSALFIFYFKQYFATIPKELEDAARVDGCSRLGTYWRVFMPTAGPIIATAILLNFQWSYTDYLGPMLYLNDNHATMGMRMVNDIRIPGVASILAQQRNGPYKLTVGIFYTIPLMLIFFLAQRYFVQGITTTGLKG